MSLRSHSRGALALRCALAALAFSAAAHAHQVSPLAITLRPDGEDFIYVVDGGGCPAYIEAVTSSPSLVKVYAVDMQSKTVIAGNGTKASVGAAVAQVFLVKADPDIPVAATVSINICWVGDESLNCIDDNCSPYTPTTVTVAVDPDAITLGAQGYAGIVGDPISSDDGEVVFEEDPDFDLGGPLRLRFGRYYASRLATDGNASGGLGPNWLHDFDWKLTSTGNNVEITTPRGRVVRFERGFFQTAWTLAPYEDVPFQLVDTGVTKLLGDPTTGLARTFDAQGRLILVEDGKGNSHALSYVAAGLSSITDGLGRTLTLTHAAGRITAATDGTRTVSFGYTTGVLTSSTDAEGQTTTYAYDPAHAGFALLTARMRPEGNTPWTQAYDASKRAISQTDALANATTLAFNTGTNATTVTDPLGNQQVHDHSSASELADWKDEAGNSVKMAYDAQNRRRSITDRLGDKTSWTYHAASGLPASYTTPDGAQTSFEYAPRSFGGVTFYDLDHIHHADGTSESFARDASGNVTTWTDRAGEQTTYTHNARGQVLTETNPSLGVTTYAYNGDATLASMTDPASNTTTFGHDALRRMNRITHPDATFVEVSYDDCDRLLTVQDELMATTTFARDDNGNVTSIVDGEGETWAYSHDDMDRVTGLADPLGNTEAVDYDERGKVERVANDAGEEDRWTYDPIGNVQQLIDASNLAWTLAWDDEGVIESATDPLANTTSFTSDVRGRTTRVTGALGTQVRIGYDVLDRWTRLRDGLGNLTDVTYDARGDVASITEPVAGATTTIVRNELGRPTMTIYAAVSNWLSSFDVGGRRTSATDPVGNQTTFSYDTRNRMDQVTLPGSMGTVNMTWSVASQLLSVQYSDGTDVDYGYDDVGRVTSTTGGAFGYDDAGRMASSNGLNNAWSAAGRLLSIEYAPGKFINYTWTASGRPATLTDWLGGTTTFEHDDVGNLIGIERPSGLDTRFQFTAEYRLSHLEHLDTNTLLPVLDYSIGRDKNGAIDAINRNGGLLVTLADLRRFYAVDFAGQLSGLGYDALGNALGDGVNETLGWDLRSRLTSYTKGALSFQIDYDGFDLPIDISSQGTTWSLVRNYALPGAPPQVLRANGVDATYVVHHPDGWPLYTIDATTSQRTDLLLDPGGSTAALSDASGAFIAQYELFPHGEVITSTGSASNPFVFRAAENAFTLPGTDVTLILDRPYVASWMRYANRDGDFGLRGTSTSSAGKAGVGTWLDELLNGSGARRPSMASPYAYDIAARSDFWSDPSIKLRASYSLLDGVDVSATAAPQRPAVASGPQWTQRQGLDIRGTVDVRSYLQSLSGPRGQELPDNLRKAIDKFLAIVPPKRQPRGFDAILGGIPRFDQVGARTRLGRFDRLGEGRSFALGRFAYIDDTRMELPRGAFGCEDGLDFEDLDF